MASPFLSTIGRMLKHVGPARISLANERLVGASGRNMSEIGRGEGKGGGGGGSIRQSGGSLGKRSQAMEEEYFRDKEYKELKELRQTIQSMKEAKIEYHEAQIKRHQDQIKEHEDMMAKDKDAAHKIYIKSHKKSVEAHSHYLDKIKKGIDPGDV